MADKDRATPQNTIIFFSQMPNSCVGLADIDIAFHVCAQVSVFGFLQQSMPIGPPLQAALAKTNQSRERE